MKTITEKTHMNRLKEKEVVIEDIFLRKDKELIRRTDGTILDEVFNGTRIRKNYFYKGNCIYTETDFNKFSNYTFVNYNPNDHVKCPNCGNEGKLGDFYEGCPYCLSIFNIDYNYKRYDLSFSSFENKGLITFFIILALIFPIFIIPVILLILILFRDIPSNNMSHEELSKLVCCLNYELKHYYYSNEKYKDMVDFHIKKYNKFTNKKINNISYIKVEYTINKYYFINNEIIKKEKLETAIMKNNNIKKSEKYNIIECYNCGASIDIIKEKCEYCDTIIPKNIEWSLINPEEFDKINKE